MPMTAVNQQMFQATMAAGDADADFSSIIKATEALANFEVKWMKRGTKVTRNYLGEKQDPFGRQGGVASGVFL